MALRHIYVGGLVGKSLLAKSFNIGGRCMLHTSNGQRSNDKSNSNDNNLGKYEPVPSSSVDFNHTQLDDKTKQQLEKFKQFIAKNSYYDKYKSKILQIQKSSPKSLLGVIDHLMPDKPPTFVGPKIINASNNHSLNDIMKLEMLLRVDRDDIVFIWQEHHHHLNMLAATMTSKTYDSISSRGKLYNTIVLPLPRDDGHELFLVQYSSGSFYFTPLIKYHQYKENAPVCLSLIHFTELREDKDLILMRGEWDKDVLSLKDAQFLSVQLNLYYGHDIEERFQILKTFNQNSSDFDHNLVIEELKRMQNDFPHLFPK